MRQAISNLVAMRETEGSNIYGDFIKRADLIAEKLAVIEERSPQVVEEYQTRLSDRINELLEKHNQVIEPERLLQEVAIFADRTSITEEIVRLKSHIKQFKLIIDADQPVGRKLDFLSRNSTARQIPLLPKPTIILWRRLLWRSKLR